MRADMQPPVVMDLKLPLCLHLTYRFLTMLTVCITELTFYNSHKLNLEFTEKESSPFWLGNWSIKNEGSNPRG